MSDSKIVPFKRRDTHRDVPAEAWRCERCQMEAMILLWAGRILCDYCGAEQPPNVTWEMTWPTDHP